MTLPASLLLVAVVGAVLLIMVGAARLVTMLVMWCIWRRIGAERFPVFDRIGWSGAAFMLAGCVLLLLASQAQAQSPLALPAPARASARIHVPDASALYRHYVTQAAGDVWGIDAPVARLAAQIHQESAWDPHARSGVGAEGLAQFMPATGRWLATLFPEIGTYDPWDPRWSARAAARYDAWLVARNRGGTPCDTWAFALSAYNGGEVRLHREQAIADKAGSNAATWFGNVARYRARGPSAWAENRAYVRRILTVLEPAYIAAGWPGEAACHV